MHGDREARREGTAAVLAAQAIAMPGPAHPEDAGGGASLGVQMGDAAPGAGR